jgi:hypothetical protein
MDLEYKLKELKHDYVRIQADLEKVESTGHNTDSLERQLLNIEDEITEMKNKIRQQK